MKDDEGIGPVKMPINSDKRGNAVTHHSNYGPFFAGLRVASKANENYESLSNVGNTYQLPSNTDYRHFLTGSRYFKVSEYEVFLV